MGGGQELRLPRSRRPAEEGPGTARAVRRRPGAGRSRRRPGHPRRARGPGQGRPGSSGRCSAASAPSGGVSTPRSSGSRGWSPGRARAGCSAARRLRRPSTRRACAIAWPACSPSSRDYSGTDRRPASPPRACGRRRSRPRRPSSAWESSPGHPIPSGRPPRASVGSSGAWRSRPAGGPASAGGFYREVRIPNLCRGLPFGGASWPGPTASSTSMSAAPSSASSRPAPRSARSPRGSAVIPRPSTGSWAATASATATAGSAATSP